MGLGDTGIKLDQRGIPEFDPDTLQVGGLPLFIAGDVNGDRAILHEASDEGRIAGYNAVHGDRQRFVRRAPLRIAFSEPNLAVAGRSFAELKDKQPVVGEVRFDGQGRSLVMGKNAGILRIYGEPETGKLLGAEMIAPSGEHLAHLLAWSIQQNLTVFDVLRMPFYHPVVEEGLRTAIRDLARRVDPSRSALELAVL